MKLRACGFEIVCEFVPGFVPNAYARTRGGIRRQGGQFSRIAAIRLPDFVTQADFDWAVETASKKKKLDCSAAEMLSVDEGLCVQALHVGPYDDEPATVALMDAYLAENGYENDMANGRLHHEIYLSDARKIEPAKLKTVIRHPVRKALA